METTKKSSIDFPGVGFEDAALRVVLSSGGDFDDEEARQASQHFAIMAMHPDDVDCTGRGPGTIIADLEQFDDAEKYADLFAAAPELLEACEYLLAAFCEKRNALSMDERPFDAAQAVAIKHKARAVIAKAKGKAA